VKINDHNIVAVLTGGSLVLTLLIAMGGAFCISLKFAAGVTTGGMLAMANFLWLVSALKRVLMLPVAEASRFAYLRYLLRLAVMGGLLYLLIVRLGIDIFGLLLGLSVLVFSITGLALYKLTCKGG
jgi:ATP synthase I subunit